MINDELYRDNDLFFVCYILDMTAKSYKIHLEDLVNFIPLKYLDNLYEYADVFHCENPLKICEEIIIENNVIVKEKYVRERDVSSSASGGTLKYLVDKLYHVHYNKTKTKMEILQEVVNNPIGKLLDNYHQDFYWQSTECIYWSYVDQDEFLMYK